MNTQFGLADSTYHTGKLEILRWFNQTLKVHVDKIEKLGNGAEICQMLDYMYNKEVPMHKVRFNAILPNEIYSNWKIVKNVFNKHKIQKHIEVEKLMKCKYQDNLEFSQWFKKFFDTNPCERTENYDPIERRNVKKQKQGNGNQNMRQTMPAIMHPNKKANKIEQQQKPQQQPQPTKEVLKNVVNMVISIR